MPANCLSNNCASADSELGSWGRNDRLGHANRCGRVNRRCPSSLSRDKRAGEVSRSLFFYLSVPEIGNYEGSDRRGYRQIVASGRLSPWMPGGPHSRSKVWKAPDCEISKPGENRIRAGPGAGRQLAQHIDRPGQCCGWNQLINRSAPATRACTRPAVAAEKGALRVQCETQWEAPVLPTGKRVWTPNNVYGTTYTCGVNGGGTAFEFVRPQ